MATAASRLSSSRARGRLALWLVAALVLAALVVGYLVVDRGNGRRDAVAAYIVQANTAQRSLLTRLGAINTAYAKLRLDPKAAAAQAPVLADARRTIAGARSQLAALQPPPEARVLHRRLLRLLTLEDAFARDVTDLARRLSDVAAAQRELALATSALSDDLRDSSSATVQARAFDRYSARLAAASARLSRQSTPVLLAVAKRESVTRLRRLAAVADGLGAAIGAQQPARVTSLLRQLEREVRAAASASGGSLLVSTYNRRVRSIAAQRSAVATELRRLDRDL
jgi:hypothetical protein